MLFQPVWVIFRVLCLF